MSAERDRACPLTISHGSCSSDVCAGQRLVGVGEGMRTATAIMNVCDDVSRDGGRGSRDSRRAGVAAGRSGGR